MGETTEVTNVDNASGNRVVKYSVTEAELAKLEEQYRADAVPEDLTIKENYELVRKAAGHIRGLRSDVEKRRKELKADALAWGKLVDSKAKEITERLIAIEEPYANKKKDFDTAIEIAKREAALAEERRVDGIAERIAGIKALVEANISSSATTIRLVTDNLAAEMPTDWADEFREKASGAITETMAKLQELLAMKVQQEESAKLAAEAEIKRKQEEEEARKQREIEIEADRKRMAEERASMEAEKAKMAAELAKMKAEKDAAEEARKTLEDASKYASKAQTDANEYANTAKMPISPVSQAVASGPSPEYKAAGNAILTYVNNKQVAKNLLDAIISGKIPNITFTGAV